MAGGKVPISVATIELPYTDAQLKSIFGKAVAEEASRKSQIGIQKAIPRIKSAIVKYLMNTDVSAILNDDIRGQLGLTPSMATSAVAGIVQGVSDSVRYSFKEIKYTTGGAFKGGITIKVQPTGFSNIFASVGMASSIRYYSIRYKKVVTLDWLDWILNRGDAIIVTDAQYVPDGKGRSGVGSMDRLSSINVWKVPSEVSGTQYDNIITRALRHPQFLKIIEVLIKNSMK